MICHLVCKYPWVADPNILQDNGAAALAFQKRLEAKQLKEKTFLDYCKCFQDMIDRTHPKILVALCLFQYVCKR